MGIRLLERVRLAKLLRGQCRLLAQVPKCRDLKCIRTKSMGSCMFQESILLIYKPRFYMLNI